MSSQIELSPEDFQEDLRHLGRANGNIWQRFPALAGVHDGQVMVRLKQLRFVILDYSIPNPQSRLIGASSHVKVPRNAGVAICNTSGCPKIGVPVCLYDSKPSEPDSLYLRSGLCFQCQRGLNEKRRAEKRKAPSGTEPSLMYTCGNQKVKLSSHGIVICKEDYDDAAHGEGWRRNFRELGPPLVQCVQTVAHDTTRLVAAAPTDHQDMHNLYQKVFRSLHQSVFLLSQWKSSWDATFPPHGGGKEIPSATVYDTGPPPIPALEPNPNMVSLLLAADQSNDLDFSPANAAHHPSDMDWPHIHHETDVVGD